MGDRGDASTKISYKGQRQTNEVCTVENSFFDMTALLMMISVMF